MVNSTFDYGIVVVILLHPLHLYGCVCCRVISSPPWSTSRRLHPSRCRVLWWRHTAVSALQAPLSTSAAWCSSLVHCRALQQPGADSKCRQSHMPAVHGSQAQPDTLQFMLTGSAVEVSNYLRDQLFITCKHATCCDLLLLSAGDDPALGCPVGAGSGSNGAQQLADLSAGCQHRLLFARPQLLLAVCSLLALANRPAQGSLLQHNLHGGSQA